MVSRARAATAPYGAGAVLNGVWSCGGFLSLLFPDAMMRHVWPALFELKCAKSPRDGFHVWFNVPPCPAVPSPCPQPRWTPPTLKAYVSAWEANGIWTRVRPCVEDPGDDSKRALFLSHERGGKRHCVASVYLFDLMPYDALAAALTTSLDLCPFG